MKRLIPTLLLTFGLCSVAQADIWMWFDLKGNIHFVNTDTAIYTWLDEAGRVQFSDKPGHEDAVLVDLVWHSEGDELPEVEEQTTVAARDDRAWPGETDAERNERLAAEAYYCKRAQEVYDSYLNAPRLYKTLDNGERRYLTDEEMQLTLTETKARVDELCG